MNKLFTLLALCTACASLLGEQQDLATRVHKATIACTVLPATKGNPPGANALKAKVCTQAQLCQSTAKSAADALQAANTARSTGTTDVAAEAKAAGLNVLAHTACKQGGW